MKDQSIAALIILILLALVFVLGTGYSSYRVQYKSADAELDSTKQELGQCKADLHNHL